MGNDAYQTNATQKKTDIKMQGKLKTGQYYASKYRKLSTKGWVFFLAISLRIMSQTKKHSK